MPATGGGIPAEVKRAYREARRLGMSVTAAAQHAGISRAVGQALESGDDRIGANRSEQTTASGRSSNGNPWANRYDGLDEKDGLPPVLARDELCDEAAASLEDFGLFRRRYLGRGPSPWQEDAGHQIVRLLAFASERQSQEYLVLNAPPGAGKSTLWHDVCVWMICRDRRIRILYGSRTNGQAMKYTQRIRLTLQQRGLVIPHWRQLNFGLAVKPEGVLAQDFGRFKPQSREMIWQKGGFTVEQVEGEGTGEKEATVTAFGFDSDYLGMRVDLAIWDDLVDYDNIRNAEVIENLQTDWDNIAENRIDPGGLCVLQGQRLNHNDLYRYCLDKKVLPDEDADYDEDDMPELVPKYHHIIYRAHDEGNCRELHKKADPPWRPDGRGGCLLDPRRLPWLGKTGLASKDPDTFRVVFQQEDLDPEASLIQKVWVDGGEDRKTGAQLPGCWDTDRGMWERPVGLKVPYFAWVAVDPSPSNYWACQFWIYEPATERRYLIALERKRMSATEFLDWDLSVNRPTGFLEDWWVKADEINLRWRDLILEFNVAQKWLDQYNHVTRWKTLRGVTTHKHTTGANKTDKDMGIPAVRNHWKTGRIRLPGNVSDGSKQQSLLLVNEMLRWPHGATDDQVMSHWFGEFKLPQLAPRKPDHGKATQRRPSWMNANPITVPSAWHRVFGQTRRPANDEVA